MSTGRTGMLTRARGSSGSSEGLAPLSSVRPIPGRGFGEGDVRIVDPAMGTGTYLHTIIERVAEQAADRYGPAMAPDAIARLASRLYGFELQMGPFAVAELRTSDLLKRHRTPVPEGGRLLLPCSDARLPSFSARIHCPGCPRQSARLQ